jgi:type IV secretion system protein VirB10
MPPVVIEKTVTIIKEVPAPQPLPVVQEPDSSPEDPDLPAITAAMIAGQNYRSQNGGLTAIAGFAASPVGVFPVSTGAAPPLSPLALQTGLPPLTAPNRYQAEGRESSAPIDNDRILAADRIIPAVMENGINSQIDGVSGGSLILQVSRDVFGYHGRKILVPKGSRMICEYKMPEDIGATRLDVRCDRILLGGSRAEIFELKSKGTDEQGRLGFVGEVDNRLPQRYGTAVILAGMSAVIRAAASSLTTSESQADQNNSLTTGAEELSKQFGEISAAALEKSLDIKPIIVVPQGTRVTIRSVYDWYIKPVE